jgi:RND family efflux transporter MFP subunit
MNRFLPYSVAAMLLLVSCSQAPEPAPRSAPQGSDLAAIEVGTSRAEVETAYDGVLEAVNQSTVSAQTSARVVELPFDVGDYVAKGEVIVRFTDTEQRARLVGAEASLAEAKARVAEAEQQYERIRNMYERKLVAKAEFDRATADLEAATARLEAAHAALDEAREGLEHTIIRAPYSGIVVERHIEIGETATVGRELMTGLSLEHLRAAVQIPQQHIGPLRKHRKARVILPDGESVEATELRIPPNADPDTHTFRVLVTLPQGNYNAFPGSLVKVAFVTGEQDSLLVPEQSVVRRGELTGVYVIGADKKIELRYVRIGTPAAQGQAPVLAGLISGETIATDPIAAAIAYQRQSSPPE